MSIDSSLRSYAPPFQGHDCTFAEPKIPRGSSPRTSNQKVIKARLAEIRSSLSNLGSPKPAPHTVAYMEDMDLLLFLQHAVDHAIDVWVAAVQQMPEVAVLGSGRT